jgi:hypothetical protein
MSGSVACPVASCWQALFNDELPPEQKQCYERHLQSCPDCQEHLDQCDDVGETRDRARRLGDPTATPPDPTLLQILDELHGRKIPLPSYAEQVDLYFLKPDDRPGILGTLGGYEVQEVIGQGGMGVVLKAFDPALHRLVAIKVMAPALAGSAIARLRFTREAQAAAAVSHDHIVVVHGVHETAGLPYLVMEYIAGESVQERLDRVGPLETIEIVRIGLQTALGLAAAHAQGLIHRDIKPANLLLENGLARVKITDFGLARMVDDVQLTQAGVLAGTPEYMAPEQARGESIDHRADLFSLGSVLYALCSGVPPFSGTTAMAVLRQVSDLTPPPVRSLNPDSPAWMEAVIARLMAKDPAQRLQSAKEAAALLEGYLAHLRQPALVAAPELPAIMSGTHPGRPTMLPRMKTRRWLIAIAAVACLLGLAGVIGAFVLHNQEPAANGERKEAASLEPKPGLACLLVNKNSGRCLTVFGKSDMPGVQVVQGPMPEQAGACERWTLVASGEAYRLRNDKTLLFLDIHNARAAPGNLAVQAPDDAAKTSQNWTLEPNGDGYLLRPGHCPLVLGIAQSSLVEGERALQWNHVPDCMDQVWLLRPAPPLAGNAADPKPPAPRTDLAKEYYWPFKGEPADRQYLELSQENPEQIVRFEADGLRIKLPKGNPRGGRACGLTVNLPLKGDFEISLNFEILEEPEQADAGQFGTALTVIVNLQQQQWTAAGCYRGVAAAQGTQFRVWTTLGEPVAFQQVMVFRDGKVHAQPAPPVIRESGTRDRKFPTQAKTGRIRLARTGSKVAFWVAEGANADFKLLEESPFRDADVDRIRISGCTGGPQAAFDARITDLRIKTGSLVMVPAEAPQQGLEAPRSWLWLVALLTGAGVTLALAILLLARYRRRKTALAAVANTPADAAVATRVAFRCSACGRNLKARSELAGKKVKCPHCGQPALVPEMVLSEAVRKSD